METQSFRRYWMKCCEEEINRLQNKIDEWKEQRSICLKKIQDEQIKGFKNVQKEE